MIKNGCRAELGRYFSAAENDTASTAKLAKLAGLAVTAFAVVAANFISVAEETTIF